MKSTRSCAKNVRTGALFLSGIAALVLQVPLASAADFGLGVAHQGSGNTVLIPIRTKLSGSVAMKMPSSRRPRIPA